MQDFEDDADACELLFKQPRLSTYINLCLDNPDLVLNVNKEFGIYIYNIDKLALEDRVSFAHTDNLVVNDVVAYIHSKRVLIATAENLYIYVIEIVKQGRQMLRQKFPAIKQVAPILPY